MKKSLFILFALVMSAGIFAQNIPFDGYGNVLLPDYESYADDQVVKIVLTVSNAAPNESVGPGWGIGEIVPIGNYAVKSYELKCKAASTEGAVNEYEFTIADLKAFAKVDGVYWEDAANGNRKGIAINVYNGAVLTAIRVGAAVVPSAIIHFESDEIGTVYEGIAWSSDNITAVVETDPAAGTRGKSLHVTSTNWNSYPKFPVTLPDGKTVADIEKVQFDLYLGTGGSSDQNTWKSVDWFIGAPGASFTANAATGQANNLITNDATQTWIAKEMAITTESAELLALNAFDFGMGLLVEKADYYLDNIAFVLKESNGIISIALAPKVYAVKGGITVNALNEKVSVYGIDGRLVKQTVSNSHTIPLPQGLYIVKTGSDKATKVWVN
ncbi:MAG: T9SS type A sorting domain-containing protein [Dysgonamonadaceae bacterium]|nr:T9SS type A sorting domain-containing protein [Dysgonamonadaceae bacterium]